METDSLPPTTAGLPERFGEVFRLLRGGTHICREEVAEYRDLERHEDLYRAQFEGLGYELVHHDKGFFYFEGCDYLSVQRLQAITLFVLILMQDLDDKEGHGGDRSWERTLLTRTFQVNELPHFQPPPRRSLLHMIGVTSETVREDVLHPMAQLGMLKMVGSDRFQFRAPIYRFVDLRVKFGHHVPSTN